MNIEPTGKILGARVTGVDLRKSLSDEGFARILTALGDHGVLCFPGQLLQADELVRLSSRFGSLQVLRESKYAPGISVLSNIIENGQPIGSPDAGQFWHTDMPYNKVVGFVNVLSAHAVPTRDGKPLGGTEFANTQKAYEELSDDIKSKLKDATAWHDLNKSWEWLIKVKKSPRAPLTEAERRERPPVQHPVFLTHPITGRKVIYVNPNTVTHIEGMTPEESEPILETIYEHVLQPKYRYAHHWTVGDVLIWDHLGTWHNAIADYGPNEPRKMLRCQVLADRIFDPAFVRASLGREMSAAV